MAFIAFIAYFLIALITFIAPTAILPVFISFWYRSCAYTPGVLSFMAKKFKRNVERSWMSVVREALDLLPGVVGSAMASLYQQGGRKAVQGFARRCCHSHRCVRSSGVFGWMLDPAGSMPVHSIRSYPFQPGGTFPIPEN